ncbi:hypothetical protein F890_03441 [Acinetobacter sp. CIP 64.7]|nr:hypothetical protein F890_03441 [Acinetobacter sp. CIP 64.7]
MTVRIYVRASTKDQDAERALSDLIEFSSKYDSEYVAYIENYSGTKLSRPELNRLLDESEQGDVLLVESVDRLSRLDDKDFDTLKEMIKSKGLLLVILDLPTTHEIVKPSDELTRRVLEVVNSMLIDLLATMARLDQQKRVERIMQGLKRSGYKPSGKTADAKKHKEVRDHLKKGNLTKAQIAKLVGVSESQVYKLARVVKIENLHMQGLTAEQITAVIPKGNLQEVKEIISKLETAQQRSQGQSNATDSKANL